MASSTLPNQERLLVRMLREIASERDLELTAFSKDWCLRLAKGDAVRYVYGYKFGLNSASAHLMADDKCAASDVMQLTGIPHVEHRLFLKPDLTGYVNGRGNWAEMLAYAQQHDFKLVCKANEGTSGQDVFRVKDQPTLEQAVHQLFQAHRGVALSPFVEIAQEYRVVLVEDNCELLYAKERPTITGDGQSTVAELITHYIQDHNLPAYVAVGAFELHRRQLKSVLPQGESLVLTWKHNLSAGAWPVSVEAETVRQPLIELALRCKQKLNLRLAVVDVIKTNGQLMVLEVNSGLMMEGFARRAPDGYAQAKAIYDKVVALMFTT